MPRTGHPSSLRLSEQMPPVLGLELELKLELAPELALGLPLGLGPELELAVAPGPPVVATAGAVALSPEEAVPPELPLAGRPLEETSLLEQSGVFH